MLLKDIWQMLRERWDAGLGKIITRWGRRTLIVGVLVYLLIQLSEVGWRDIWNNLPANPLFYLIFLGMYFGLPVAETFIYRKLWNLPFRQSFPVMLKKRVYNREVINYSGEAHLYWWANKSVELPGRRILRDIKDNTILSSLTSLSLAITLLGIFFFAGLLPFEALIPEIDRIWIIGGGMCLALLVVLGVRFRRSVISLPASVALVLLGLHLGRLLFVQTLQVLQWAVVMPEVPWSAWFALLALQIIVNQLPFLPAKELVVVGASTELTGWMEVSQAGVVSMLLVVFVLDKVINLVLFSYLSFSDRQAGKPDSYLEAGEVQENEQGIS